jgi:hypothetical protein
MPTPMASEFMTGPTALMFDRSGAESGGREGFINNNDLLLPAAAAARLTITVQRARSLLYHT